MMKVALIGSRDYANIRRIKDTLFQLKQKFKTDLIVISGGAKYGADKFKPYHVSQFHHRNMLIARDCDVMIAFISEQESSNGSMSAIKKAKKLNKPVTIII